MKKKLLSLFTGIIIMFNLCSCNFFTTTPSQTANTIEQDKTVYEIQNSITDVKTMVESACVGIYTAISQTSYATGSGVVYKEEDNYYYVITNHHVIEDGKSYKVYLGDSKYYNAYLIGSDSKNDIAVLRFSLDLLGTNKKITPIDISTEDVLNPGQTAIAIGCPLSLNYFNHITVGVVTGVTAKYVQTDAALNSGNSGGGLFNLSGRLIGINVSKTSWTSETDKDVVVEGFGNAIRMDIVRKCVFDIEAKKTTITRPLLGVSGDIINRYLVLNEEYTKYLPNNIDEAFLVTKVTDGNAKNAGVNPFDVIYMVNDKTITKREDISKILDLANIGDVISLKIYRLNNQNQFESLKINVTLQ